MPQPDLDKTIGQILTVEVICNGDRSAIVIPISTDDPGLNAVSLSGDAVVAFENHLVPVLQAVMTSDASIIGVSAEGMTPGGIPYRRSYIPATYPGLVAPPCMPSNVCGLITFYADPTDLSAGQRMREGKAFITGIPTADVSGDEIENPTYSRLQTFGAALVSGWATQAGGGHWYRVISKKTQTLFPDRLINVQYAITRNRVATQKRRLQPA